MDKTRAARNRTITFSQPEREYYREELLRISKPVAINTVENKMVNNDIFEILDFLPINFANLLILDPPYNLNKTFKSISFRKKSIHKYAELFESWLVKLLPKLKQSATVYVCCDWYSSTAVHLVLEKYLKVRNRIT